MLYLAAKIKAILEQLWEMPHAELLVREFHSSTRSIHPHRKADLKIQLHKFAARATPHLGGGHVGSLQRASYQRLLCWAVGGGEATGAAVLVQRAAMQHHRSLAARE